MWVGHVWSVYARRRGRVREVACCRSRWACWFWTRLYAILWDVATRPAPWGIEWGMYHDPSRANGHPPDSSQPQT